MRNIDNEIFNIQSIQIRELAPVKVVTPFQDATMGPFPAYGMSMITIEDENGHIGEAPVYSSYTNILEACLVPHLLYSHDISYSELYAKMYWSIRNEGFRGPASALLGQVDMALHDLAARRLGVPLHKYMGAARNDVRMYGSGGGTNYSYEELEKEVAFFVAAGVGCYKMKVGKDFGTNMAEDVKRVKFVRSLLGKNIRLAADANQIWSCEQALRFIDQTAGENLAWFEEPIHSASFDQIEALCKRTPVKIAFGESERTAKVFPTLVNIGVGHLQPVPGHLAGVKEWMAVKELAEKNKIDFSSGGYSLFTASLMTTASEQCEVEYLHSIMSGLEIYFAVKPEWRNGRFFLPDNPGLPVKVNWSDVEDTVKIVKMRVWNKKNVREYQAIVSL
ncbi:mandelate racemase/muconate lactonizing enzyme family protein [Chitinophaga sp. 22321]|uniref:Mandelate racemase/muconate lactonizing enzyme family protein n=1 Tax=Chitinophaga hostae TaxID=2831022 RepID=A0ABS5IYM0_9BACT|nr:mandelate racemase/muconate lactonizing enzyme family protein [Chitinophaga hostae]MBS0028044.1 mandelate racemase/muconate lactonizing enzyme family protein [Chitinophaga hostae]